jgi:hypothetical protein
MGKYFSKSVGRNSLDVGSGQYSPIFLCFNFSFFVIMDLEMCLVCCGVTVPEARQKKVENSITKSTKSEAEFCLKHLGTLICLACATPAPPTLFLL